MIDIVFLYFDSYFYVNFLINSLNINKRCRLHAGILYNMLMFQRSPYIVYHALSMPVVMYISGDFVTEFWGEMSGMYRF